MNKFALISVSNKSKILKICRIFKKLGINILATGSTAKYIKKKGYNCKEVSKLTKFREMLDGRVKTLNPKIHASLLFKRNNKEHVNSFKELKFPEIDFVIVNLYPIKNLTSSKNIDDKMVEMIDIGGPSLLRSSAKNFKSVTTISNINDYDKFIDELKKHKASTSLKFRKRMALKVFKLTSSYDKKIFENLENLETKKLKKIKPVLNLRYGENPIQKAKFLYKSKANFINKAKLNGKDLSYNNILDIDSAISCINEFAEPTCGIIKHNNPCGIASDKSIIKAFSKAYQSDSISSYGGVVILNRKLKVNLAKIIYNSFFEIVIAQSFDKKSIQMLKNKKNIILIELKKIKTQNKIEIKSALGGFLVQDKNLSKISTNKIKCVSKKPSSKNTINDLIFALKVCKHVKSNSIVLVKNKQTVGIGAGQMSRIDATKVALMKLNGFNKKVKKFIAASDAFFPFNDSIKLLFKKGCISVIQPQGSKNDNNLIDYANTKNKSLYFIKERFFKH